MPENGGQLKGPAHHNKCRACAAATYILDFIGCWRRESPTGRVTSAQPRSGALASDWYFLPGVQEVPGSIPAARPKSLQTFTNRLAPGLAEEYYVAALS